MTIITTDNLKAWLGVTDERDDESLNVAVAAANEACVTYCGRDFEKDSAASPRHFSAKTPWNVYINDVWSLEGFAVATDPGADGTFEFVRTLGKDFYLLPLDGRRAGQVVPYDQLHAVYVPWPLLWRPGVQVTARWGWPSIPDAVFEAALIMAARLFRRKDSPDGLLGGYSDLGSLRVSNYEDPDVVRLLKPYRVGGSGVLIA